MNTVKQIIWHYIENLQTAFSKVGYAQPPCVFSDVMRVPISYV